MPLPKLVDLINWVNDTDPAINDTHLNQMDSELDAIDDRVIAMEGAVETQAENAEAWAVGERGGTPVDPTDPTYNNNSEHYAGEAASSASDAAADALKSEGFAVGEQGGGPVASGSPYYENNAKHYASEAADSASDASSDAAAAASSAEDAEAWSEGTRGGVPVGPGDPAYQHNAHYWEQQAQGAIAGVTSFTGAQGTQRSGPVTAQSGDYDDGMITVDRTGTSLPSSVNDLHDVLELLYPQGVSVTLTLNGAKEDIITIKDSNDATVGTCTFASGQTSGTVSITVPNGGGSYKFVSSVSKSLSDGTSDYEKTVTLSDAASQTVNVFPKNALYWFGNEIVAFTAKYLSSGSVTKNTNSIILAISGGSDAAAIVSDVVNLSNFSKIKCISKVLTPDQWSEGTRFGCSTSDQISTSYGDIFSGGSYYTISSAVANTVYVSERSISYSSNMYVKSALCASTGSVEIMALILDDGHENDITIHGTKEDTITITDSNNQTVATCVFGSGSTVGYVSKSLLPSGTYTFTSSVAKDTTDGTSDYAKTIVLDGSETEVEIYPDNTFYWYGNKVDCNFFSITSNGITHDAVTGITENTNSVTMDSRFEGNASLGIWGNTKHSSGTIKALASQTATTYGQTVLTEYPNYSSTTGAHTVDIWDPNTTYTDTIISGALTMDAYDVVRIYTGVATFKAFWKE